MLVWNITYSYRQHRITVGFILGVLRERERDEKMVKAGKSWRKADAAEPEDCP